MGQWLDIHGVNVHITSSDEGILDYASQSMNYFLSERVYEPHLTCELVASPRQPNPGEGPWKMLGNGIEFDGSGQIVFADAQTRIWCHATLKHLQTDPPRLSIIVGHNTDWQRRLYRWATRRNMARMELYMSLVRQGVVIPTLSLLCVGSSAVVVHGSVVSQNGRAIAFVGLNGCGKSSLMWYLVERFGFGLLSDNFTIIDTSATSALCFPGVLRVNGCDVWNRPASFDRIGTAYGKRHFVIPPEIVTNKAKLAAIILVALGPAFSANPVLPGDLALSMGWLHAHLRETPAHSHMRAFWTLTSGTDLLDQERARIEHLSKAVPAFRLTIPLAADPSSRYSEVAKFATALLEAPVKHDKL